MPCTEFRHVNLWEQGDPELVASDLFPRMLPTIYCLCFILHFIDVFWMVSSRFLPRLRFSVCGIYMFIMPLVLGAPIARGHTIYTIAAMLDMGSAYCGA